MQLKRQFPLAEVLKENQYLSINGYFILFCEYSIETFNQNVNLFVPHSNYVIILCKLHSNYLENQCYALPFEK